MTGRGSRPGRRRPRSRAPPPFPADAAPPGLRRATPGLRPPPARLRRTPTRLRRTPSGLRRATPRATPPPPPGYPPPPAPGPRVAGLEFRPGIIPLRPLTLGDLYGAVTKAIRGNVAATIGLAVVTSLVCLVPTTALGAWVASQETTVDRRATASGSTG